MSDLRSSLIRLAHSMPGGSEKRRILIGLLASDDPVMKLARDMPISQALVILGLTGAATAEEAKHAYRELAKANHPDRGGDLRKMQEINAAFMVVNKALARGTGLGVPKPSSQMTREEQYRMVKAVFSRLQPNDLVEVSYGEGSQRKIRTFLVEKRASHRHEHVYVWPARRNRGSQQGALIDYGTWQADRSSPHFSRHAG